MSAKREGRKRILELDEQNGDFVDEEEEAKADLRRKYDTN